MPDRFTPPSSRSSHCATPSSLFEGQISSATASTWGLALATATPVPDSRSMAMSMRSSPNDTVDPNGTSMRAHSVRSACFLFASGFISMANVFSLTLSSKSGGTSPRSVSH